MPIILSDQLLPTYRTNIFPLKAVLISESTKDNTLEIIDQLFLEQLNKDENAREWEDSLQLMIGDQKTVNLILSCKKQRQATSGSSYGRLQWLQPVQGLFHTQLNYLQAIRNVHWGPEQEDYYAHDGSTLQYACDKLRRPKATNGKLFKLLEELILHTFDAKVLAIAITHLPENLKSFRTTFVERDQIEAWLHCLDESAFEDILDKVSSTIFDQDLSIRKGDQHDDEYTGNLLFLRHVLPYKLLSYAIKHGDLSLLREALRQCTLVFQASSCQKGNYAREMVRFLAAVDGDAADKELADAQLKAALVNRKGRRDTFYPTDMALEHINAFCRQSLSDHHSSFDKGPWLQDRVMTIPYHAQLREAFDKEFGDIRSGAHITKQADSDIFAFATDLAASSLRRHSDRVAFMVPDLFTEGKKAYPEACLKYNRKRNQGWDEEIDVQAGDSVVPDLDDSILEMMTKGYSEVS